jgi:hypothetical protein
MRAKLSFLLLLPPALAAAQGVFTYTYGNDTSPLHLTGTFQASQEAVATGQLYLRQFSDPNNNILTDQPHYIVYQGIQCPIFWVTFPVDPKSGEPVMLDGRDLTQVVASANYHSEVEIDGGIPGGPSQIVIWQYGDPIAQYDGSFGQWRVSYSIPEPSAAALLLLAFAALATARVHQPPSANQRDQTDVP